MDLLADFEIYQIVCLEHQHTCLYAEVIQVIKARQICWARPLILSMLPTNPPALAPEPEQEPRLYDLRQGVDLLWPISLFRSVLDTEVIPLLTWLQNHTNNSQVPAIVARYQLNQFVRQVWQAYPEAF